MKPLISGVIKTVKNVKVLFRLCQDSIKKIIGAARQEISRDGFVQNVTKNSMGLIMSIKSNSYKKIWSDQEAQKNYKDNFDRIFHKPTTEEKMLEMFIPALNKTITAKQAISFLYLINETLSENNIKHKYILTGEGLKVWDL